RKVSAPSSLARDDKRRRQWRIPLSSSFSHAMSSVPSSVPVEHNEETNARILAVSEDLIAGFVRRPFHLIAEKSGVPLPVVLERIRAMLEAGVIRRVRQTLLATKLAHGALCAWKVDPDKLDAT